MLALLLASCLLHRPPEDALATRLESEVQALRVKNQLLESRLALCANQELGADPELARQLYQVFGGSEVLVERREALTVLVLPGALLFPPESVTLRQEALPALDLLATALALHPEEQIWVVGHAVRPPKAASLAKQYPTAWEWSEAQANSVMRALVKQFGVDQRRLAVAGRGDASPLVDPAEPDAELRNRRVEVVFGASLP